MSVRGSNLGPPIANRFLLVYNVVFIILPVERNQGWAHPKAHDLQETFDSLLGWCINLSWENLTGFWILASLMDGYMLIVYTASFVTPPLLIYISSSISFRSDAWKWRYMSNSPPPCLALFLSRGIQDWRMLR